MAAHGNEEKICCALCFLDARHAKRLKVCLAYKRMRVVAAPRGGEAVGSHGRRVGDYNGTTGSTVRTSGRVTAADKREINRKSQFGGHSTSDSISVWTHTAEQSRARGRVGWKVLVYVCVCELCDLTIASLADLCLACTDKQTDRQS